MIKCNTNAFICLLNYKVFELALFYNYVFKLVCIDIQHDH